MYSKKLREVNIMRKIIPAMITGTIIGATASMMLVTDMDSKQRRKMIKNNRRAMENIKENIGFY